MQNRKILVGVSILILLTGLITQGVVTNEVEKDAIVGRW